MKMFDKIGLQIKDILLAEMLGERPPSKRGGDRGADHGGADSADLMHADRSPSPHAAASTDAEPIGSALATQVGGDHYSKRAIQPVEYIHANGLSFLEGCVVKRITRWRDKDGLKDLLKVKQEIDLIIDLEGLNTGG